MISQSSGWSVWVPETGPAGEQGKEGIWGWAEELPWSHTACGEAFPFAVAHPIVPLPVLKAEIAKPCLCRFLHTF